MNIKEKSLLIFSFLQCEIYESKQNYTAEQKDAIKMVLYQSQITKHTQKVI